MKITDVASAAWTKAKEAGGGAHAYWMDGSKITPSREGDTPFLKALQIVDRRDGYAMKLMRTWRTYAAGMTAVAAIFAGGWWYQAQKAQVHYFAVPIDRLGDHGPVYAPKPFEATSPFLARRVRWFIPAAFGLSSDPEINRENYAFIKRSLRGAALKSWNEWWDEYGKTDVTERVVRIVSIKPTASPNTFNAIWDETDKKDGQTVAERRVNGDFTVEYTPPKTVQEVMDIDAKMPITAMRFAPEVGR